MAIPTNIVRILAPRDGQVLVTAAPVVTEREIVQERGDIIQTLHAAYATLNEAMAPFQERWKADPRTALAEAIIEGGKDGGATWLAEQADMLESQYWVSLYQQAEKFSADSIDKLAIYGRQQYNDIKRQVNHLVDNPGETLGNWAFWEAKFDRQMEQGAAELCDLQARAQATVRAGADGAQKARMIYKHRAAIMHLPILIAEGDPKPIQAFVENELKEIDPDLAREIRGDPRFALALEVLADHESVLTYLAYSSLMVDAIPPNFYAYVGGKGALFLFFELILLIATALLSAGAAAAGRVALLVARIGATAARVSGASRTYQRAKMAAAAFTRAVEDLETAMKAMHQLAPKVMRARQRGVVARGATGSQIDMKKDSIRRDGRCRICGSSKHNTPKNRRGTVKYE